MADGLYYRDDGKKFFANGQEVNGANNLVQSESKSNATKKHAHHKHKSKKHHKHHSAKKNKTKQAAQSLAVKKVSENKKDNEEEFNKVKESDAREVMKAKEKDQAFKKDTE